MLTWTDCPATTPEQQIIFAQLEILRRLDPARVIVSQHATPNPHVGRADVKLELA
jgi:hypothetical protein